MAQDAQPLHPVGPQHTGQDPHGRGLARAVGAEQPEHATGFEGEVDAIEHHGVTEGPLEPKDVDDQGTTVARCGRDDLRSQLERHGL